VLCFINSDGTNLRSIPVPSGVTWVDDVAINEDGLKAFFLDNGIKYSNNSTDLPVYFGQDPNDNGTGFDETADDGFYTNVGTPGDKIHEINQMTVRMGAMDESKTVVVKDVILNIGGTTGIEIKNNLIPDYKLFQNYPNTFNPTTAIRYSIPGSGESHLVKLVVFNLMGEKLRTLVNIKQNPGNHSVKWDGRTDSGELVSSGVYLYRLRVGKFVEIKKMMIIQ